MFELQKHDCASFCAKWSMNLKIVCQWKLLKFSCQLWPLRAGNKLELTNAFIIKLLLLQIKDDNTFDNIYIDAF